MKRTILFLLILLNSALTFGQISELTYNGGTLSNPTSYVEFNGRLYFAAVNPSTGNRAMFSMDTSENIQLEWSAPGADVRELISYNNKIYLTFSSGSTNPILLEYQGSGGGAVQIADIAILGELVVFSDPVFGERLYFSGEDQSTGATGGELYAYDGTSATLIADQIAGADGLMPNQFEIHDGRLYFTGFVSPGNYGVYSTDGNTIQLISSGFVINEIPKESFNNQLYYVKNSTNDLLSYDSATSIETNIYNGTIDVTGIFNLETLNNKLVLGVKSPSETNYQPALLNTSGVIEAIAFENLANAEGYFYTLGVFSNRALIRGSSSSFGLELYEYVDGQNNTKLVQDYNPGSGNSTAGGNGIIEFNGNIYMDARSSNASGQVLVVYKPSICQNTAVMADVNFEAYLEDPTNSFFDALGNQVFPSDGIIGNSNVCLDAIELIDELFIDETIVNAGIVSFVGIENFTALTKFTLRASPSGLTSLDLTSNSNLKEVNISDTVIENLTFPTNNNTLQKISLSTNNLSGVIDVSGNTALTEIQAILSSFSSINTTNCSALKILDLDTSAITSLDLSTNTNLESLNLDANPLTDLELDSGNYPNLTSIIVTRSAIQNLTIRNTAIAGINLNEMAALNIVNIEENDLLQSVSLDNPGAKPVTITRLSLRTNDLTGALDISDLINITTIDVSNNANLTSLDVTGQVNLEFLTTYQSGITEIDLSTNNGTLSEVTVGNTTGDSNLTSLNLNNTGNNLLYTDFILGTDRNPGLNCIEVHNTFDAEEAVNQGFWSVSSNQTFNTNCSAAQTTTEVPDDIFEAELERLGYGDGIVDNNRVLTASIAAVKELDLTNMFINELTGIAAFTSLEVLTITGTNTTAFDLTANPNLIELNADLTSLISLNTTTSQNTTLRRLSVWGNSLSAVDLSNYSALEYLDISENQGITELSLTNHSSLVTLLLEGAGIVDLELSQTALTSLNLNRVWQIENALIYDNANLTSIEISAVENPLLNIASFRDNNLQSLNLRDFTEITSIDVKGNSNLTTLDITDLIGLELLDTAHSGVTAIDLSTNNGSLVFAAFGSPNGNSSLTSLNLNNSNSNLDYTAFTLVTENNPNLLCIEVHSVSAAENAASGIDWDVPSNQTFSTNCSVTPATTTVPDDNFEAELERLGFGDGIANNNLVLTASIEVVTNLFIQGLDIANATGIEAFKALESLEAEANRLTTIDVSNLVNLEILRLGSNQLNTIDIKSNTKLRVFEAANNNIKNIDFSKNNKLNDIYVFDNAIKTLDVSTIENLELLTANGNPLECVKVDDVLAAQNLYDTGDWLTESRDVFSLNCNSTTSYVAEVFLVTDILNTLNINEGLRNIEIQVSIPNSDTENLIVEFDIEVIGVTAAAGEDFNAVPQNEKLTYEYFNDGLTTYNIGVLDDNLLEGNEQVRIRISNPSDSNVTLKDADVNGNVEFVVTILDDERALAELSAFDGAEGSDARITVNLRDVSGVPILNNTGGDIIFDFALANGSAVSPNDFSNLPANTKLIVDNGSAGAFIDIPLIDDTDEELQEDFSATISNPNVSFVTISEASATVTIAASDNANSANDNDGDGILNNLDNCNNNSNANQSDLDNDGIGDVCDDDIDGDGVTNIQDICPNQVGTILNNGCPLQPTFDIGPADIHAQVQNASCPGVSNGIIAVELFKDYNGTITVSGSTLSASINKPLIINVLTTVEDLAVGTYKICVTLAEFPAFEQCYNVNVFTYEDLEVATQGTDTSGKSATFQVKGSTSYKVKVNDKIYTHKFESTKARIISAPLEVGKNNVHITGASDCQGVFTDEITIGHITAYPNPVIEEICVQGILGQGDAKVVVANLSGKVAIKLNTPISNGKIHVDFTNLSKGIYLVYLRTSQEEIEFKIVKK